MWRNARFGEQSRHTGMVIVCPAFPLQDCRHRFIAEHPPPPRDRSRHSGGRGNDLDKGNCAWPRRRGDLVRRAYWINEHCVFSQPRLPLVNERQFPRQPNGDQRGEQEQRRQRELKPSPPRTCLLFFHGAPPLVRTSVERTLRADRARRNAIRWICCRAESACVILVFVPKCSVRRAVLRVCPPQVPLR